MQRLQNNSCLHFIHSNTFLVWCPDCAKRKGNGRRPANKGFVFQIQRLGLFGVDTSSFAVDNKPPTTVNRVFMTCKAALGCVDSVSRNLGGRLTPSAIKRHFQITGVPSLCLIQSGVCVFVSRTKYHSLIVKHHLDLWVKFKGWNVTNKHFVAFVFSGVTRRGAEQEMELRQVHLFAALYMFLQDKENFVQSKKYIYIRGWEKSQSFTT